MAKRLLFGNSRWGMAMRVIVLFVILTAPFFYHYGITFLLGRSMYPAYECSEVVLVSKIRSGYIPKRYDVVQINAEDEEWVKRIIGLPGDRIQLGTGRVWVNGKREHSYEYLDKSDTPRSTVIVVDIIVPQGMVWVIGDNRYNSAHKLIYVSDITGKVLY